LAGRSKPTELTILFRN